ncbi:ACT domain-containing protein [Treponema sp. JC4]|uniref:ACT domain-containing protein n=1 Tax=Treponema sp. JC4 TaxID=1124982 RepID=UPI00025B04E8|nr:ACT domain-containing protein [Treponema sp. JC4]EID85535.1 ACT domain-containing protein [Treponema sp. JC4]
MTINQISIFIENRKNALLELTNVLAEHKINVRALCLADTSDFGIARIIVDDPVPVQVALERSAYIVKTTPVIALEIPDEAGSLNHILQILADGGRNVEYMYGFTGRKTNAAFMVIRTTDVQKTEEVLAAAGIRTVSQAEVPQL